MKKRKLPKILWHHGTCNCCGERLVLLCHFGYDSQLEKPSYKICEKCLSEKAHLVLKE